MVTELAYANRGAIPSIGKGNLKQMDSSRLDREEKGDKLKINFSIPPYVVRTTLLWV